MTRLPKEPPPEWIQAMGRAYFLAQGWGGHSRHMADRVEKEMIAAYSALRLAVDRTKRPAKD